MVVVIYYYKFLVYKDGELAVVGGCQCSSPSAHALKTAFCEEYSDRDDKIDETRALPIELRPRKIIWSRQDSNLDPRA